MAKFASGIVDVKDAKGNVVRSVRCWLPLNREALLEPITDEAVALGAVMKEDGKPYTQAELEAERVKIQQEFRQKEREAIKRRKPYDA